MENRNKNEKYFLQQIYFCSFVTLSFILQHLHKKMPPETVKRLIFSSKGKRDGQLLKINIKKIILVEGS